MKTKTIKEILADYKSCEDKVACEHIVGLIQQQFDELEKELDELKAHCYRLKDCLEKQKYNDGRDEKCLGKTLASTPQQSLAEIKARAIEKAIEKFDSDGYSFWFIEATLKEFAEQLRNQANIKYIAEPVTSNGIEKSIYSEVGKKDHGDG